MASSAVSQLSQPCMNRLDAAHALLGVSPSANGGLGDWPSHTESESTDQPPAMNRPQEEGPVEAAIPESPRPASNGGLDALASLAMKEQETLQGTPRTTLPERRSSSVSPASSDDDSEAMPPPPPRPRPRSISNPEGMEKWGSLDQRSRRDFVLPSAILEEELLEASAALKARNEGLGNGGLADGGNEDSSEDESNLSHEELLRRARSRLLEDLSEGSVSGDKGVLMLPHTLAKYKEVYNKNGRIGIYTPPERAAIIARFQSKKSRRVWNKKIRYNCRKNLADRRMRVKGRFVKRSTEQQAKAKSAKRVGFAPAITPESNSEPEEAPPDENMPDVNDPDAGFAPTEDQPYRRLRRHTIT